MSKKLVSILSLSLLVVLASGSFAFAQKPQTITFAVQNVGTSAYGRVAAIAQVVEKSLPSGWKIELLPISSGGLAGTLLVENEKAVVGIGVNVSNKLLFDGKYPGVDTLHIALGLIGATDFPRGLVMFTDEFHKKHPEITSLEDLVAAKKSFRVVTKPKGSGGELGAQQMLEVMGVTYDDIRSWGGEVYNIDPSVMGDMLREGKADVSLDVVSVGQPAMTELTMTAKMFFPKFKQSTIDTMVKQHGYAPGKLAVGSWYGQKEELPTFGQCEMIAASKKLPEEIAYTIVKAVCEGKEELVGLSPAMRDFDAAIAGDPLTNGLPLHPGAAKYYREKGYIK